MLMNCRYLKPSFIVFIKVSRYVTPIMPILFGTVGVDDFYISCVLSGQHFDILYKPSLCEAFPESPHCPRVTSLFQSHPIVISPYCPMSNRYEITSLIKKDRIGEVYMAQDMTLERKVIYRKLSVGKLGEKAASKLKSSGFSDYTGKLCALQHPNLLTIYDIGHNDEGHYMVTQYIEGELIEDRLTQGPLGQVGAYNMMSDLLDAMHAMHEMGIYHGALHSNSVKRMPRPRGGHLYLIVDLGLDQISAMIGDGGDVQADTVLLAPELLDGKGEPDARSDLFALGQLCYIALAGGHPMAGNSVDECLQLYQDGGVPDLKEFAPDVQGDFCDWVMRLVATDPAQRLATVDEAMKLLHSITMNAPAPNIPGVTQAVVEVAPHTPPNAPLSVSQPVNFTDTSTSQNGARKKRMMMIGGAIALLLVIVVCAMVFRGGESEESEDVFSLTSNEPIFLHPPKMLQTLESKGGPVSASLDIQTSLDWTIIRGVPSASERINKEEGSFITSISSCGEYKEFEMPYSPVEYSGNGLKVTPHGGMTNVEKGMAEFGQGWQIMLHIPKKHQGAIIVTLYMLQDHCDFNIEVKEHETNEVVTLLDPYAGVGSTPGVVQIPIEIKKPTPGGFYTIKILASSENVAEEFAMGLSAVLVQSH